jgi:DNA-binding transcriptional LysR family regulator
MSIPLLKTLIAVAERGSFAAAAGVVHVSQAAVGQQMRRLEELLEVELFDRAAKSPQLNALGHALVPKARAAVQAYDGLLDGLVGESAPAGELTLGAVPSTLRGLVPRAVKQLIGPAPELQIRVVPGLSDDLAEQVERGALDAAITSKPENLRAPLHWREITREELVLIAAPDETERDVAKLLAERPYIRHTRRASAGVLAERWLRAQRITVRPSMEMESLETVASVVAHGLGVSVVPNICVPDEVFAKLLKLPLGQSALARELGLLTRSDNPKLLLMERLMEQLLTLAHT